MASKTHSGRSFFRAAYPFLAILLALSLSTCDLFNVGLGSKVDVTAPSVDITSPSNGAYESGEFQLKGTVTDDIGVKSVTVAVTFPSGSGLSAKTFDATVSGETWSLTLDAATLSPSKEVSATVTVTAMDTSGKTDESPIKLYLDDVAPTVTLSSPTAYNLASADYYKQNGYFNGSVRFKGASDTDVASLVFTAGGVDFTPSDGSYASFNIQVDTELFADGRGGVTADSEGILTVPYTLYATDNAGNKSVQYTGTFLVRQDADNPKIAFVSSVDTGLLYSSPPSDLSSFTSNKFEKGNKIKGTVTDDDGLDPASIRVTLTSSSVGETVFRPSDSSLTVTTTASTSTGKTTAADWCFTIPTSLDLGLYSLKVEASDLADAKLAPLASSIALAATYGVTIAASPAVQATTVDGVLFVIKGDAPEAEIGTLADGTYSYASTSADIYFPSGSLTVSGTAADAFGVKYVKYRLSKTDAWTTAYTVASPASGSVSWSFNLTGMAEGGHMIYVVSENALGEVTTTPDTAAFSVDTKGPVISVKKPLEGTSVDSTSYDISGTAYDAGAGFDGTGDVDYKLSTSSTWIPLALSANDWSATIAIDPNEGPRTLNFRSADAVGNVSYSNVTFYYDLNYPALTETAVNTTAVQYTNSTVAFGGSASDTNAMASASPLTVSRNSAAAADVSLDSGGVWHYTFDATSPTIADGSYVLTFTATDVASKQTVVSRNVVVDKTLPVVTVDAVAGYQSAAVTIAGDFTETNIAGIEYQLGSTAGTWKAATIPTGTTTWEGALDVSTAAEGSLTLYVRALDKAGNYSAVASTTVFVDRANPRATETNHTDSLIKTNAAVTFAGQADDASITAGRAATSAVLTYSKDGGNAVTLASTATSAATTTATTFYWDSASGTWSWTLPADLGDGIYVLNLTVRDQAYGSSSGTSLTHAAALSRSVQLDTTAPLVSVESPGEYSATESATIDIRGTARDTGTGAVGFAGAISDVEYRLTYSGYDSGWVSLGFSSGINWSLAGLSLGAMEGIKVLEVRATDAVGNQASKSVTFYYDKANPTLTETLVNTSDTRYANVDVNFGGTASDSNALDSLVVSVSGPATATASITPAADGSWAYTFASASFATDGDYTLTFTATDAAKKTTVLARTIRLDRTAPLLTVSSVIGGEWKTSASQSLAGTVTDGTGGSDVARVEYRISSDGGTTYCDWATLTIGSYNSLAGNYPYSGTVSFPDGNTNVLEVRAVDKAGNTSTPTTANSSQQTVWIDTVDPSMDITSPTTTPLSNAAAGATISVIISATDATSGAAMVYAKVGSSFAGAGDTGDSSAAISSGTATVTVSIAGLAAGTNRIYLRARDAAGRHSAVTSLSVLIDKTAPTVALTSHASGATINKTVAFSGNSADANGVASCVVQLYNAATSSWVDSTLGTAGGTTSWTLSGFNTTTLSLAPATWDGDGSKDGVQLEVRVMATDNAGNIGYSDADPDTAGDQVFIFTVDQDADKPVIKLSNLETTGGAYLNGTKVIYGTVTDDDGTVSSFKMSTSAVSDWSSVAAVPVAGNSFSYTIPGVDGSKTLYFQITDAAGTIFTTAATESDTTPRLWIHGSPATYTGLPVGFNLDTKTPDIGSAITVDTTSNAFVLADTRTLSSGDAFGGTSTGILFLRIEARDANGIMKVEATVSGKKKSDGSNYTTNPAVTLSVNSSATPVNAGYTVFDMSAPSSGLSLADFADGTCSLDIAVTDNAGNQSVTSKSIVVDSTLPSLSFITPSSGAVVNGELSVKGLANDDGSGLSAVRYKLGKAGAPGDWTEVTGSLFNWEIAFTGANKVDNYANSTYATDDGTGVWTFPILLQAVDKAGNTYTSGTGDFYLKLDPSGDKPAVTLMYPTDPSSPLGGSVRIYGTASDDDAVYKVFMQIDTNDDGVYDASDVAGGTDWYAAGLGREVTGQNNWSQTINASGEFNPSGDSTRTINFRVRAQDTKNGTSGDIYGPWVTSTIVFDNNVPKIGSSVPLYLDRDSDGAKNGNEVTYSQGMYISGTWYLRGSVEDDSAIADIVVSGALDGTLSAGVNQQSTWFVKTSDGRYDISIPIATVANEVSTKNITITAIDNTSPSARSSAMSLRFEVDNAAATGTYSGDIPVIQSNGVYKVKGTADDSSGSGIRKIELYFVRTGSPTRFYKPTPAGGANTVTRFDSPGTTATFSNGSAIYPTDSGYILTVDYLGVETTDAQDSDGYLEKLKQGTGTTYEWYMDFNSLSIPDGPIDIHYVVYDMAGNATHYVQSTRIQNNGPSVTAITLGTDLNQDTNVTADETTRYTTPSGSTSTAFIVKGAPMTLYVDVSAGNGSLTYDLSIAGTTFSRTQQPLRTGSGGTIQTITLGADDVATIGEGERTFTVTVWDSTEETTTGTNSLYQTRSISCTIKTVDSTPPVSVIRPFYWNSASDNSLYQNSKTNGHIELEALVGASGASLTDSDPKVSGKVSIRGTAYDDQFIRRFYARIDGLTFSSSSVAVTSGNATISTGSTAHGLSVGDIVYFSAIGNLAADTAYYVLSVPTGTSFTVAASYSGTGAVVPTATSSAVTVTAYRRMATYNSGSWSCVSDTLASNGWAFAIANTVMDQDSHQVSWTLDWDSSMIAGVAGYDKVVRVLAMDKGGNLSAATAYATGLVSTNNVPAYQVDVVPYIRSISNPTGSGLSSDVIRSSTGAYSIESSTTATPTFDVVGFNLGAATTYTPSAYITSSPVSTAPASPPTDTNPATTFVTNLHATVSKQIARSGYLTVFVNGIPSINNLDGTSSTANANNMENVAGNPWSTRWNDHRYLNVWAVTQTMYGTSGQTYYYPDMIMSGTQPIFMYCNDNDGSTYRTTGDNTSASRIGVFYERLGAIAANSSGTYYMVSVEDSFNGTAIGNLQINRDASGNAVLPGSGANFNNGNAIYELVNEDYSSRQLNRFKYPKLIVEGANADTQVYMVVYDAHSSFNSLRFFSFQTTSATADNLTEVSSNGGIASNGNMVIPNTAGLSSQYFAMTKVGTGKSSPIAIAYYDQANGRLMLTYSSNHTASNICNTGATWTTITVDDSGYCGSNVSMTNDGTYLYLAYYDSGNANLKYTRIKWSDISNSSANYGIETPKVIDAYLSAGTWTNIALITNGTATLPCITYYSDSFNGTKKSIKVAWPVSAAMVATNGADATTEAFTGNWEVATVPAYSVPKGGMEQFNHTQIGVYAGNSLNLPVVGWLGDKPEYAKLQPNN